MKQIYLMSMAVLLVACGQKKSDPESRKEKIEALESANASSTQLDRKQRSMAYCLQHQVPVLESMPVIGSDSATTIRTQEEIVQRAFALCYLGLKSEGLDAKRLEDFDKKYGVSHSFTENEKSYVFSKDPTEQQGVEANWRYESLHVLLWTLGYIDSLKYPAEMCNVAEDVKIIFSKTKEQFAEGAKLRSKAEILDQADLIYRLHWACVEANTKQQEPPAKLNAGVVYERHYCLNWLINYMNDNWDSVSTDT